MLPAKVTDDTDTARAASTPDAPAASVRGLSKSFKGVHVLEDVSFDVAEGEALVLLGASGSGKTTILRIIAGLERPDSGSVHLHGRDVSDLPARERGVGVIFQSYALFPRMTVEQNVGYGLRIRGRKRKERREKVESLLELVHLVDQRKKLPSQLSGGQQQRVAIARTLAYEPQMLLFDEPFGALDAQIRVRLRREIRALLREVGVPALFITHDQEEALELGDRIAVLHSGHLEQIGTPEEVYNRPESEYVATFLGAANLLLGVVARGNRIELGTVAVEAGAEAARFREGQSVKLVFRPEDVRLSKSGEPLPAECNPLANGVVEEKHFVGAYERLTVRLDLVARRPAPGEPPLYEISETPERRLGVPVIVTRPKPEASAIPLRVGDRVTLCLTSFRVLPNFPLATERGGRVH
ncbi:MAG: sulfate/thiosulfate transport system ATP-binding protein [Acidobacteriota bacterium]|jgi:ABC-type Fe3+/spermidine/putrescine transport system ATPase subunit|nr:sulfate/thiosulfate transport system ATP-binding protein [Acidobacteriota bacterium]